MPSFPRVLFLFVTLLVTVLAVGCTPHDQHVFVSTVHKPTSIALLDTYQNQEVWSMDIPVNHKLQLHFEGDPDSQSGADGISAQWVNWKLYRADDLPTDTGKNRKGTLVSSDRIDLAGKKIRMQVSYRPAPEIPGSVDAAPVPVQETPQSVAAEAIAESKAQAEAAPVMEADEAKEAATETTEEATEEAAEEAAEASQAPVEEEDAADAAEEAATQPTK